MLAPETPAPPNVPEAPAVLANGAAPARGAEAAPRAATSNANLRAPLVTGRAILLGLGLAAPLSVANVALKLNYDQGILGGIHMPPGAVFVLALLILAANPMLKWAARRGSPIGLFSAAELMTIYVMLTFAFLISTVGTDSGFMAMGVGLVYFSTRGNRFAELFYDNMPGWMTPGLGGKVADKTVADGFYLGQVAPDQIPWNAWVPCLIGWGVMLLLCYATLFFASLILRRQWIQNEALSFPLLELPLAMTQGGQGGMPPAREFWSNGTLWLGFGLAFALISLRSLNAIYPDFPSLPGFFSTEPANEFAFTFTEYPYSVLGKIGMSVYLAVIGITFLLNRELSFSLWFFFLLFKAQLIMAGQLGYPVSALPADSYLGNPEFQTWQTMGGWFGVAGMLLWSARGHIALFARAAWGDARSREKLDGEPYSPRFALGGFAVCFAALLGWSLFAGISPLVGLALFSIYVVIALVLGRLVVEAGFIFPQLTFAPLDFLGKGVFAGLGAGDLTRLTYAQPSLFLDARTNLFPAWIHALKIGDSLGLDARQTRRLLGAGWISAVTALVLTLISVIVILYHRGGLSSYAWFTTEGPQYFWDSSARMMTQTGAREPVAIGWGAVGVAAVVGMTILRARFLWFPFHPLGLHPGDRLPDFDDVVLDFHRLEHQMSAQQIRRQRRRCARQTVHDRSDSGQRFGDGAVGRNFAVYRQQTAVLVSGLKIFLALL